MPDSLRQTFENEPQLLKRYFDQPLRAIARRSIRVWFNRDRLDKVLVDITALYPGCELIYAIDIHGRQISSNIQPEKIDQSAYGQDLSRRPIAVSLSALCSTTSFLCDAYISSVTRRPCVTVMYSVGSGSALLGYIALDFDPEKLARLSDQTRH